MVDFSSGDFASLCHASFAISPASVLDPVSGGCFKIVGGEGLRTQLPWL